MSREPTPQGQPLFQDTAAGGETSRLAVITPAKRPLNEDIQFVSSNPVKKRKSSGQGKSAEEAQPDQVPTLPASTSHGATCPEPPLLERSHNSTGGVGLVSQPASSEACERGGGHLSAMENFVFPQRGPSADTSQTRASEAISPKQLPQTTAPNGFTEPGSQNAPPASLPAVSLDQISCLNAAAPPNFAAMDTTSFNTPFAPGDVTSQFFNRSAYLPFNPHAVLPFSTYPLGGLMSLPGVGPWVNPSGLPTTGTAPGQNDQDKPPNTASGQSQGLGCAENMQAPESAGASTSVPAPKLPGPSNPTTPQAQNPHAAAVQQDQVPKPPCLVCERFRREASHGQGQNLSHRGHDGHTQGTPMAPPFPSFGNMLPPNHFYSGGARGMAMHPAGLPPSGPWLGQMPTANTTNHQHQAGGNYTQNTLSQCISGPGTQSSLGMHMFPSQYHSSFAGRPAAGYSLYHNTAECPKPTPGLGIPTSNTGGNRSGTPIPATNMGTAPPPSGSVNGIAAPIHATKQPSPGTPPPSPATVAKRKHARNLLVDVAETVEEIFPFEEVARRHGVLPRKVIEALAAVVQIPLLRCATDKRRAGKLGTDRMKEYREARKMWAAREAEGGGWAKPAENGMPGSRGGNVPDKNDPRKGGEDSMAAAPSAAQLANFLPPTSMPPALANGAFAGPWRWTDYTGPMPLGN